MTALITGASSGLGKEFARIHAEQGGNLIIVARSQGKLDALKNELEAEHEIDIKVIVKDLSKPEAPQEVYDAVKSAGLEVDYLINNAGFGGVGKFHEREWQDDLDMIHLNVVALTALTRHFLPEMVERNFGRILNVSSTASLMPGPLQAVYYATKAYVTSFNNAIAEELHDTKVTVTNLMPGATDTSFGKVSGMDKTELFKNTADPRTVAEAGFQGMLDGKLDVIAGVSFAQKMMMKMVSVMPKSIILKQVRKMQKVED